jgi:phosphate-selective porin OprO/OprP
MRFHEAAKLRAGKFKPPVGLERLQSGSDTVFVERALPTNLVPNRDLGLQLHGDLWKGVLGYQLGAFNGVPDGSSADIDSTRGKELAARIFAHPFKTGSLNLRHLGFGVSATHGTSHGSATASGVAPYRTAGQQPFFSYRADGTATGTVVADGNKERLSPQAYWYRGRLGVLAEHVVSSQEVRLDAIRETIRNEAWQATVSFLVTDDMATFKAVAPGRPFELERSGWGALELAARYSALEIGDEAFPIFANAATSASEADEYGIGVNWYLTRNVRIALDYLETRFEGGGLAGADREPERLLDGRVQVSF